MLSHLYLHLIPLHRWLSTTPTPTNKPLLKLQFGYIVTIILLFTLVLSHFFVNLVVIVAAVLLVCILLVVIVFVLRSFKPKKNDNDEQYSQNISMNSQSSTNTSQISSNYTSLPLRPMNGKCILSLFNFSKNKK